MKSTTDSMARSISEALVRKGAPSEIRGVTVEEMIGQCRRIMTPCILVRHEGSRMAHVFDLAVDRETLPPGIADSIAVRLMETALDPIRNAEHSAVEVMLSPFTSLLPDGAALALDSDRGTLSEFSLFCEALDHQLGRGMERYTGIRSANANDTASRTAGCETRRAAMLDAVGGDRKAALRCCPVAERTIAENPDKWRTRMTEALEGMGGMNQFLDGIYRPMIHFGSGVRWRQSTLIVSTEFPETVRTALVGRPLTDVFRHSSIPDSIMITGIAQRRGDGEAYVRTDAETVPLEPSLDLLKLTV